MRKEARAPSRHAASDGDSYARADSPTHSHTDTRAHAATHSVCADEVFADRQHV